MASNLDTYKQTLQPNAHAGSERFSGSFQDDAGIPLKLVFDAMAGDLTALEFLVTRRAYAKSTR